MKRDPRTLDLKDSATISDVIGDGDVMTDDGEYIYVMTDAWGVNGERAKIYKIRESDMSVAGVLQPGARSMFKSPRIDGGYVYFIEVYDRIASQHCKNCRKNHKADDKNSVFAVNFPQGICQLSELL